MTPPSATWIAVRLPALALVAIAAGCRSSPPSAAGASLDTRAWRQAEEYRPSLVQLQRARLGLPESLSAIVAGLDAKSAWQAQQQACLLEALGAATNPVIWKLRQRLAREDDPVLTALLIRVLAAADDSSPETLALLSAGLQKTQHPILKTYFAGALLRLAPPGDAAARQAGVWLHRSLQLEEAGEHRSVVRNAAFWEQVWAAVYMLERAGDRAQPFIPDLRRIGAAFDAPGYVQKELLFAVDRLGG